MVLFEEKMLSVLVESRSSFFFFYTQCFLQKLLSTPRPSRYSPRFSPSHLCWLCLFNFYFVRYKSQVSFFSSHSYAVDPTTTTTSWISPLFIFMYDGGSSLDYSLPISTLILPTSAHLTHSCQSNVSVMLLLVLCSTNQSDSALPIIKINVPGQFSVLSPTSSLSQNLHPSFCSCQYNFFTTPNIRLFISLPLHKPSFPLGKVSPCQFLITVLFLKIQS